MGTFTKLETAALDAIAAIYPEHAAALRAQLSHATVMDRVNKHNGFRTDFTVDHVAAPYAPLSGKRLSVMAHITGFRCPMEVGLFVRNGYAFCIGGETQPSDDTSSTDFTTVRFTIR